MDVSLQTIALWVLPVVFAITLHEAAHGYVAKTFGDRTAEMQGRITLNPLKHIDPVGTILVPGLLILTAKLGGPQFVFGWAKPVRSISATCATRSATCSGWQRPDRARIS